MRIELTNGNQGVLIQPNGNGFYSVLLTNCGEGLLSDKAQVVVGKGHSTEAGARRWAAKQLAN